MLYQVKEWDTHYENDRSRERDRCAWCSVRNKQDGLGYSRLLAAENGPAIYGCFVAIVLMASKQSRPRDGWLTENGKKNGEPLDAEAISLQTKFPIDIVQQTLKLCSDKKIGWIEAMKLPADSR